MIIKVSFIKNKYFSIKENYGDIFSKKLPDYIIFCILHMVKMASEKNVAFAQHTYKDSDNSY